MDFQRKEQIQITVISGKVETSLASLANYYDSDWYINIILKKDIELTDYVEVNKDSYQIIIDRQEINPYFYELGFFETIESISYDQENLSFWSGILNQLSQNESPALYNTLFDIMSPSLELKAPVFNIQLLPIQTASTTSDVVAIVNKMNEIQTTTTENQIAFVQNILSP